MPPLVPLSLWVPGWTMARMPQLGEAVSSEKWSLETERVAKTGLTHWKGRRLIPVSFSMFFFSRIRSIWSWPSVHCVECNELCTRRWMLRLPRKIGQIGLALNYLDFLHVSLEPIFTSNNRVQVRHLKVKEVWTLTLRMHHENGTFQSFSALGYFFNMRGPKNTYKA